MNGRKDYPNKFRANIAEVGRIGMRQSIFDKRHKAGSEESEIEDRGRASNV